MQVSYVWTDGADKDFIGFSQKMETYYNRMVGGSQNRKSFIPYNALHEIHDVIVAYADGNAIGCASYKEYNPETVEIKRVWVEPSFRGLHIAKHMMAMLEQRAKEKGYRRAILQTRETCIEAVELYASIGYCRMENYPPYDTMEQAICYGKAL